MIATSTDPKHEAAVRARYEELLRLEPQPAEHCDGLFCIVCSGCRCTCRGCARARTLLAMARFQIIEGASR